MRTYHILIFLFLCVIAIPNKTNTLFAQSDYYAKIAVKKTVKINVYDKQNKLLREGRGVFISKKQEKVLTSYKLVQDAYSIVVTNWNNQSFKVDFIFGYDNDKRTIILMINNSKKSFQHDTKFDMNRIRKNERVWALDFKDENKKDIYKNSALVKKLFTNSRQGFHQTRQFGGLLNYPESIELIATDFDNSLEGVGVWKFESNQPICLGILTIDNKKAPSKYAVIGGYHYRQANASNKVMTINDWISSRNSTQKSYKENPTKTSPATLDLPKLIELTSPSIVTVIVKDARGNKIGSGTGFFINNGDIVTNYHVLEGSGSAEIVTKNGLTYPIGNVIAESEEFDLIQVSLKRPLKTAPSLTLSHKPPKQGEKITVIGSPFGLEQTVSEGIISQIRDFSFSSHWISKNQQKHREYLNSNIQKNQMIQISAPISQGSSGSPVLNQQGEVVGVVSFYLTESQNLNFAVAINRLINISKATIPKPLDKWAWGVSIIDETKQEFIEEEKPREIGQEWVKSYTEQLGLEQIWNGRKILNKRQSDQKFHSIKKMTNTRRHQLIYPSLLLFDKGYYLHDGYLYTENEFPAIQSDIKRIIKIVDSVEVSGKYVGGPFDGKTLIYVPEMDEYIFLNKNNMPNITHRKEYLADKFYMIPTGDEYYFSMNNDLYRFSEYDYVKQPISRPVEMDLYPEPVDINKHKKSIYYSGLVKDFKKGYIEPQASCDVCNGSGHISCKLCDATGFLVVQNNIVKRKNISDLIRPNVLGNIRNSSSHLRTRSPNSFQANQKQKKGKRIRCQIQCDKGKLYCPNCVLIDRPKYKESFKEVYLNRWNNSDSN